MSLDVRHSGADGQPAGAPRALISPDLSPFSGTIRFPPQEATDGLCPFPTAAEKGDADSDQKYWKRERKPARGRSIASSPEATPRRQRSCVQLPRVLQVPQWTCSDATARQSVSPAAICLAPSTRTVIAVPRAATASCPCARQSAPSASTSSAVGSRAVALRAVGSGCSGRKPTVP